jgi:hypothetical protein
VSKLRRPTDPGALKPDPHYQRSLLDRMGAEGADLVKAVSWSIVPTVAGLLIGVTWTAKQGLPPNHTLATAYLVAGALIGMIIFGGGAFLFIWGVSRGAGRGIESFVHPSGEYNRDYSREDSLVARGDVPGAIASFKVICDAEPENLEARLRAAELHRKNGTFDDASALYREVQSKSVRSRDDVHASLRLIDLYLAWPEHEGRSMRELKRLIDKYPGSEIEKRSKSALADLKRERFPAS